ncbi:MAG: hypothetical protein ABJ308_13270 [Halieaceae bacterium]
MLRKISAGFSSCVFLMGAFGFSTTALAIDDSNLCFSVDSKTGGENGTDSGVIALRVSPPLDASELQVAGTWTESEGGEQGGEGEDGNTIISPLDGALVAIPGGGYKMVLRESGSDAPDLVWAAIWHVAFTGDQLDVGEARSIQWEFVSLNGEYPFADPVGPDDDTFETLVNTYDVDRITCSN